MRYLPLAAAVLVIALMRGYTNGLAAIAGGLTLWVRRRRS
jgi:nitrate reductase gamma subunit